MTPFVMDPGNRGVLPSHRGVTSPIACSGNWMLQYARPGFEEDEDSEEIHVFSPRLVHVNPLDYASDIPSTVTKSDHASSFDTSSSWTIDDDAKTVLRFASGQSSQRCTFLDLRESFVHCETSIFQQAVVEGRHRTQSSRQYDGWSQPTFGDSRPSSGSDHLLSDCCLSHHATSTPFPVNLRRLISNQYPFDHHLNGTCASMHERSPRIMVKNSLSSEPNIHRLLSGSRKSSVLQVKDSTNTEAATLVDNTILGGKACLIHNYRAFLHLTPDLCLLYNVTFYLCTVQPRSELHVDSSNWELVCCLVDGQPTTSNSNPYRTKKQGPIQTFRFREICKPRAIAIELHWERPWKDIGSFEADKEGLALPAILSHEVPEGRMDCSITHGELKPTFIQQIHPNPL